MPKFEVNLVDSHFAHDEYCVAGVSAESMIWRRGPLLENWPTVLTHESMYRFDYRSIPMEYRFGFLLESQSIIPRVYSKVRKVIPTYEMVFTHSEKLLSEFENTRWIPGGGIWVGGRHSGGEIGITTKTRMASMLTSNKMQTPLHRSRYKWAKRLERLNGPVDVFKQAFGSTSQVSVYETLRDYRYSIVVENFIDERYFTEKVLNCFATGTVPIYLGARRLGDFFESDGFITFNSWEELHEEVLPRVSELDYCRRLPAIEENLRKALEFRSIEDYVFKNHLRGRLPLDSQGRA